MSCFPLKAEHFVPASAAGRAAALLATREMRLSVAMRTRRHIGGGAGAPLAAAFCLAACGAESPKSSSPSAPPPVTEAADTLAGYTQECGVELGPVPGFDCAERMGQGVAAIPLDAAHRRFFGGRVGSHLRRGRDRHPGVSGVSVPGAARARFLRRAEVGVVVEGTAARRDVSGAPRDAHLPQTMVPTECPFIGKAVPANAPPCGCL